MNRDKAWVMPLQAWTADGYANVWPSAPDSTTAPAIVQSKPYAGGTTVPVSRTEFPAGLVVVNENNAPTTAPEEMPLKEISGPSYNAKPGSQGEEKGVVVLFKL